MHYKTIIYIYMHIDIGMCARVRIVYLATKELLETLKLADARSLGRNNLLA